MKDQICHRLFGLRGPHSLRISQESREAAAVLLENLLFHLRRRMKRSEKSKERIDGSLPSAVSSSGAEMLMTGHPMQARQSRGHHNDDLDTTGAGLRTRSRVHGAQCSSKFKNDSTTAERWRSGFTCITNTNGWNDASTGRFESQQGDSSSWEGRFNPAGLSPNRLLHELPKEDCCN